MLFHKVLVEEDRDLIENVLVKFNKYYNSDDLAKTPLPEELELIGYGCTSSVYRIKDKPYVLKTFSYEEDRNVDLFGMLEKFDCVPKLYANEGSEVAIVDYIDGTPYTELNYNQRLEHFNNHIVAYEKLFTCYFKALQMGYALDDMSSINLLLDKDNADNLFFIDLSECYSSRGTSYSLLPDFLTDKETPLEMRILFREYHLRYARNWTILKYQDVNGDDD